MTSLMKNNENQDSYSLHHFALVKKKDVRLHNKKMKKQKKLFRPAVVMQYKIQKYLQNIT